MTNILIGLRFHFYFLSTASCPPSSSYYFSFTREEIWCREFLLGLKWFHLSAKKVLSTYFQQLFRIRTQRYLLYPCLLPTPFIFFSLDPHLKIPIRSDIHTILYLNWIRQNIIRVVLLEISQEILMHTIDLTLGLIVYYQSMITWECDHFWIYNSLYYPSAREIER